MTKGGKKKRVAVGERLGRLLAALVDGAHPLIDIVDRPWDRLRYGSDLEEVDAYWERVANERCLKRLKKKQWVQEKKRGQRVFLSLTADGKAFALGQRIIAAKGRLPKGMQCLVSFDIPERARNARNTLRRVFKQAEFICVHQSAWATDRDVAQALVDLVKALDIKDWVTVYVGVRKN